MEGSRGNTEGQVEAKKKTGIRATSSTPASGQKVSWAHFTQQTTTVEGKEAKNTERSQYSNRGSDVDAKKS